MSGRTTAHRGLLFVTVLLLGASLAGCAAPDGPGDGPGTSEMTTEEAVASYQQAMTSFRQEDPNGTFPDRVSFRMTVQAIDHPNTSMESTFFLDAEETLGIMTMQASGQAASQEGEMSMNPFSGGDGPVDMVFATYHKTGFFGASTGLLGIYNESAEPVEDWSDFQESQSDTEEVGGMPVNPSSFLSEVDEIPEGAEVTHQAITHKGIPAVQVTVAFSNETSTVEMTAIVYTEPPAEDVPAPAPAHIQATVRQPGASDPMERATETTVVFEYGQEASHELEDAIKRLEAMTFLAEGSMSAAAMGGGFGGSQGQSQERNWTIQPSKNPGTVPLEEAELRVEADGSGAQAQTVLTLPLEQGTASQGNVTVSFEDVDEDGHLSPGDRIVLQAPGNGTESYTLQLHDEVTGLALIPGPGLLLATGLLALVAAAHRVRCD